MIQRYEAGFAKPIVDQLIAIFQRDQQSALNAVNATRPADRQLNPFAAFFKESRAVQNWPAMVLVCQQTTFDPMSDIDLRSQTMNFYCAMAITGSDPEWLAEDAMDTLRAVDIVLTSALFSDFYKPLPISHTTVPSGMTAGLDIAYSRMLDLRVTRHDLGALVQRQSGALARGPQIEFLIRLEEV